MPHTRACVSSKYMLVATLNEILDLFVRHWSPPIITIQSLKVDVWVVSARAEREGAFTGWNQFGNRNAVPGDEYLISFKHLCEELRKLRFGFMDVVARHTLSLVRFSD